jgi:hypothetical protein
VWVGNKNANEFDPVFSECAENRMSGDVAPYQWLWFVRRGLCSQMELVSCHLESRVANRGGGGAVRSNSPQGRALLYPGRRDGEIKNLLITLLQGSL